jgi:hypothetical protein
VSDSIADCQTTDYRLDTAAFSETTMGQTQTKPSGIFVLCVGCALRNWPLCSCLPNGNWRFIPRHV